MMLIEEFDVTFAEAGDYTYWCGPHKGAGMIAVHVRMKKFNTVVLDITVAILDFLYREETIHALVLEVLGHLFCILECIAFQRKQGLRGPEHLY